jgi:16S rRNA (uracil1498-N3)-methyltransferase
MRIFIPPESIAEKTGIAVQPEKSHHLIAVMRCRKGDALTVIDGRGKSYSARISDIRKKTVFVDIQNETGNDTESAVRTILCLGVLKGEKMDFVIQKATELGVSEIMPFISERCQVRETRKSQRWRKIAEEAAEQCGRSVIPEIEEPRPFAGIFETAAVSHAAARLIFWEGGGQLPDEAIERSDFADDAAEDGIEKTALVLCIGPEGGFSSAEIASAEASGFIRSSLGKRTLRAETAAIAAITLMQFLAEKKASIQRKV